MRSSRSRSIAGLTLAAALAAGPPLSAHRTDEYLQAARLGIEPDRVRVELDLTPGISVARAVLAEIDTDRSGVISSDESQEYVRRLVGVIALDVDGHPLPVQAEGTTFPAVDAVRSGEGTIRIALAASMPELSAGVHHLTFRNGHRRDIGAYLANALVPASDRIAIAAQDRAFDQHELTVDYVLRAEPASGISRWFVVATSAGLLGLILRYRRRPVRRAAAESA